MQQRENFTSLEKFPKKFMLFCVLPLLDPVSEVRLARTSKHFYGMFPSPIDGGTKYGGLSQNNAVYKHKYVNQFYLELKYINKYLTQSGEINIAQELDWVMLYKRAYDDYYSNLLPLAKTIFLQVHEGNAEAVITLIETKGLDHRVWLVKNNHSGDLVSVVAACNSQRLKNYYYAMMKQFYLTNTLLKKFNFPPQNLDEMQRTLLHHAILANQLEEVILPFLLGENAISLLLTQDKYGNAPLHYAAECGQLETVKLILKYGAPRVINQLNNTRYTPLLYALMADQIEVAQELIKQNADIHLRNANNTTALFLAAQKGYYHLVEILLSRGADPAIEYTSTKRELSRFALQYPIDTQIRMNKFLHEKPDNRDITMLPVDIARVMGHENIVDLIRSRENVLALNR